MNYQCRKCKKEAKYYIKTILKTEIYFPIVGDNKMILDEEIVKEIENKTGFFCKKHLPKF